MVFVELFFYSNYDQYISSHTIAIFISMVSPVSHPSTGTIYDPGQKRFTDAGHLV